tara:strand:+ start:2997 stop:3821 length:825 start_codon:yes stop_codon:yes gene_type:complete
MTDYTKTTNFLAKDSLPSSDTLKIIRGSEFDTEFNNLVTAVASKSNTLTPTFTGIPAAPTAATATDTTQIATTAYVRANRTASEATLGTMSTQNSNAVAITGGAVTGITDLTVADGGTGASTLTANSVLLGNGTSTLQMIAPSTDGQVLTSTGTTWQSEAISTITATTGTLPYYGARSFGWFNGDTLAVGTNSQNFASIASTGATTFRVTFTTAMPSTDYLINLSASSSPDQATVGALIVNSENQTTGYFDIRVESRTGSIGDYDHKFFWVVYL